MHEITRVSSGSRLVSSSIILAKKPAVKEKGKQSSILSLQPNKVVYWMIGQTPKTREGRDEQKKTQIANDFYYCPLLSYCFCCYIYSRTSEANIADMEHKKRRKKTFAKT